MSSERRLSRFPERIRRPQRLSRIPPFFERSGRDRRPPIDAKSDAKPLPCHHWNDRSLGTHHVCRYDKLLIFELVVHAVPANASARADRKSVV